MKTIFWTGLFAFLVDQASKYFVVHSLGLSSRLAIDVFPPFLNFRYGENRGINFGLLDGDSDLTRWLLIALALVISGFVLWWVRNAQATRLGLVGAGFLVGGALANVLDRVIYGYVLDFLNMSCCGINNPFVFNLADVFIFLGAFLMVFFVKDEKGA